MKTQQKKPGVGLIFSVAMTCFGLFFHYAGVAMADDPSQPGTSLQQSASQAATGLAQAGTPLNGNSSHDRSVVNGAITAQQALIDEQNRLIAEQEQHLRDLNQGPLVTPIGGGSAVSITQAALSTSGAAGVVDQDAVNILNKLQAEMDALQREMDNLKALKALQNLSAAAGNASGPDSGTTLVASLGTVGVGTVNSGPSTGSNVFSFGSDGVVRDSATKACLLDTAGYVVRGDTRLTGMTPEVLALAARNLGDLYAAGNFGNASTTLAIQAALAGQPLTFSTSTAVIKPELPTFAAPAPITAVASTNTIANNTIAANTNPAVVNSTNLTLASSSGAVSVTQPLATNAASLATSGTNNATAAATEGGDTLVGNPGDVTVNTDTLTAATEGGDTLVGNPGNVTVNTDTLTAIPEGGDTLVGNPGDVTVNTDTLTAIPEGGDTLVGNPGDVTVNTDTLTATAEGGDTLVVEPGGVVANTGSDAVVTRSGSVVSDSASTTLPEETISSTLASFSDLTLNTTAGTSFTATGGSTLVTDGTVNATIDLPAGAGGDQAVPTSPPGPGGLPIGILSGEPPGGIETQPFGEAITAGTGSIGEEIGEKGDGPTLVDPENEIVDLASGSGGDPNPENLPENPEVPEVIELMDPPALGIVPEELALAVPPAPEVEAPFTGPASVQGSFFGGQRSLPQKELNHGWDWKGNKGFIFRKDA